MSSVSRGWRSSPSMISPGASSTDWPRSSSATRSSSRSPLRRSLPRGGWSAAGRATADPAGLGGRALTPAAEDQPFATVVDGGFYGPASEAWRLNREAMLLLGAGPRALLLQIAHPLVAAGVAEPS